MYGLFPFITLPFEVFAEFAVQHGKEIGIPQSRSAFIADSLDV